MQKILVVDDEPAIVTLLSYNLTQANYDVETAMNGNDALALATSQTFDAILLDLMLPGMDGVEVTRKLRQERIATPIIMITAKTDEFDKVFGLEIGADDYITKPFSPREVIARLKAVLRRYQNVPEDFATSLTSQMIQIGDIVIDTAKVTVRRRGERVQLTPKEYELLLYLAKRPHQVLKRDQLLEGVWGFDYAGQTRMVDVHMSHLRDKLEPDPKHPIYLKTVRGFGYRLEAPLHD
ncbi:DNA-binding response regulator [Secundilactobacillus paracollinoides]|uniref:DNA-binding response regulator n=1 Tax=Secundilactobacillus paracollinoides TaxID=240427 RepID=A0A1B2IZT3_9LACO|nr:response regulator transcription factor [Secundilactobacillus paracollinoides]ANZ61581.1 DNA-binding response regulator [Secundilactobacillus paracollinoides]ANZ63224.1 DNA-binding response regulator [Secundilactobacillus paracollinoides]ANZ67500.1 DNA-binding response regulator [Secundilactobacillus paracollinoides]